MDTVDRLQTRLHSTQELRNIVKNMKALAAASIRQYEDSTNSLSRYYQTVERGLFIVLRDMMPTPPIVQKGQHAGCVGAIVFGSDHGLCGRFNENVATYAQQRLDQLSPDSQEPLVVAVGARLTSHLEHAEIKVEEEFLLPGSAPQITVTVQQLLLRIDSWMDSGSVQAVHLFYHHHSHQDGSRLMSLRLLPLNLQRFHALTKQPWPSRSLPTYSMDPSTLLSALLRQYLFASLFRACAESQASEHASRLAAMRMAERNLDERLEALTTQYRHARQTAITSELQDVQSGYETLSGHQHLS